MNKLCIYKKIKLTIFIRIYFWRLFPGCPDDEWQATSRYIAAHPAAISGIDHINCPHQPRHSPVTFVVPLVLVLFPATISFD